MIAAALLYACTIVAGRMLGPAEYGRLAFAIAVAQLLVIAVASGMDLAGSRGIAHARSERARAEVVASSLAVVLSLAVMLVFAMMWASPVLAPLLGVPTAILRGAAALAALFAVKAVADRQLAALDDVRFQAIAKLIEPIVVATLLVALLAGTDSATAQDALVCFWAGTLALVVIYALRMRGMLRPKLVRRSVMTQLWRFARVAVASAVVPIPLLYGDRLVAPRALDPVEAGIYFAYASSSFLVVAQVLMLVNNVLFPAISRIPDKRNAVRLLTRVQLLGFLPLSGLIALALVIVMQLFGDLYPVRIDLLVGFSAWSSLHFLNGMLVATIMAHSITAYRRYVRMTVLRAGAFVAWLTYLLTIGTASPVLLVAGLAVAEVLEIAVVQFVLRRHVLGEPDAVPVQHPGAAALEAT